ncbi:MAG: ABC transporter substrate-binding protein [Hyphomicrobiaceae bacterium]|nr:ABC transporter substrate-binding protein [Hyphomicrobiaceae bacterium]
MHLQARSVLFALAVALAPAACALAPAPAHAEKLYDPGASDTEIRIGNTQPYSGTVSAFGTIGRTIAAYLRRINDEGGINGRKLNFISYDDGYSPPKTVELVRRLVEEDKVLLVFAPLGTASNSAIQRYLNNRKVPQLFVSSSASKWGNPQVFPWTMGWQPNYATEAGIYARHILANVKDPKIAVLMQNDDYGRDYLAGFKEALGKPNERLIVQVATYEVADPTVDSQMIQLKSSGANVLFNITTPRFAAQAIRKAAEIGWKPAHYLNNVSDSISSVMRPAGFENGQDIIVAQFRKDVTDPQWAAAPDVAAFHAFMAKYMPGADLADNNHVYGYAVTSTLVEVLRRCGDDLRRANVMRQAAGLRNLEVPLLLPGIRVNTSPTDFYPLQSLQLARFEGERWKLFGPVISSESR